VGVGTDVGCCYGAYSDRGGVENRKISDLPNGMQPAGELIEQEPKHPDDFKAHLTWVTAKRFRELVLKESFTEKPCILRDQRMMSTRFLQGTQKKKIIRGGSDVCNSDTVLKRRASFLIKYSLHVIPK
jgi:hypothetical protein